MTRHAIICGGSIGGLFAALFCLKAGWRVTVLERTRVELSGRGAGIVTHALLGGLLREAGASTADLGVAVAERVVFDRAGAVVARRAAPQVVTSWDRVHGLLRGLLPEDSHRLGVTVTGYRETGQGVAVDTAEAGVIEGDVLIGADGFRSAVRGQMLPDVKPGYAGYVVWRALTPEAALSATVRGEVFDHFGLYIPTGTQIVGYPIAGPGNDLRPGHRRYNFVWYVPATAAELGDMLTDASGHRHDISIPPPLVRDSVVQQGEALARAILPPPFVEILARSERPFFTPIYDHCAPEFARGRVALIGDAASVARPHLGMGVTKAAADAAALARQLGSGLAVPDALAAYSALRQPAGKFAVDASRKLGAMIFTPPPGTDNADGRSNPHLETIVAETAVVPEALRAAA